MHRGWIPVAATALALMAAAPAGAADFTTSFEASDAPPTYTNTSEASSGVSGTKPALPGSVMDKVSAVTANAENPPNEIAVNLKDGDVNTKWLSFTSTGWAAYQLSTPVAVQRYQLASANDSPNRDPQDWQFQGSNNGTDWTTLDTRTGQSFAGRFTANTYDFTNATAYSYYRLNIMRNHGDNIIQLSELVLSDGTDTVPPPTPMRSEIGNGPVSIYTAKSGMGWTGLKAFRFGGSLTASGHDFAYNRVYDVDIPVTASTELSYKIFPEFSAADQARQSTYAAVDLQFDDGTFLRKLGAIDQHGYTLHARAQGESKSLYVQQWNAISSNIGAVASGKTIKRILVDYDNPNGMSGQAFQAWIDDLRVVASPPSQARDHLADWVETRRGANANGSFSRGNNIPPTPVPHGFNLWIPGTPANSPPRPRGPPGFQLRDPGAPRNPALWVLPPPGEKKRKQKAAAAGFRGEPRAEPVDGRPPDVPGDAVAEHVAGHRPHRPRARVQPRRRDGQAVLLRRHVHERPEDRDRADRPRGGLPLHVRRRHRLADLRQRQQQRRHHAHAVRRQRADGLDRLLRRHQRRPERRRPPHVRLRRLRPAVVRGRWHRRRALPELRQLGRDDEDRDVVHQRRAGAAQPRARADRQELRRRQVRRARCVGQAARRGRRRGRDAGPDDDAVLRPLPPEPVSQLGVREHREQRRAGLHARAAGLHALHARNRRDSHHGRPAGRGQALRQQRLLGHLPDRVGVERAAVPEQDRRDGRRLRPAVQGRRLDRALVLAGLRRPDGRRELGRRVRDRVPDGRAALRRASDVRVRAAQLRVAAAEQQRRPQGHGDGAVPGLHGDRHQRGVLVGRRRLHQRLRRRQHGQGAVREDPPAGVLGRLRLLPQPLDPVRHPVRSRDRLLPVAQRRGQLHGLAGQLRSRDLGQRQQGGRLDAVHRDRPVEHAVHGPAGRQRPREPVWRSQWLGREARPVLLDTAARHPPLVLRRGPRDDRGGRGAGGAGGGLPTPPPPPSLHVRLRGPGGQGPGAD